MEPDDYELMLDIETLGTNNNAVILSIGVTVFSVSENNPCADSFYCELPVQPQIDNGRTICASTLKWWQRQKTVCPIVHDDENEANNFAETVEKLVDLCEFIGTKYPGRKIWAHGTTFDIVRTESLLEDFGMKVPWSWWSVMDCRTVTNLIDCRSKANNHNALDDAINQARWIIKAKKKLAKIKE
ncbi:MAG: 3'-5' exoribonuclease [Pseudomonadales bacterium]|nr:3'-5' exoribonuclease [Pseudomonadales bacterium]